MGNAKSRNNTEQIVEKEFSRILSSNKELPTTTRRKWKAIEDNQLTTTITSAAITVGGPLSVEVKNNKTTENSNKTIKASQLLQVDQKHQQQQCNKQRQQKAADSSANSAAAEQQRLKQASSLWNLGSLNWNLSYSGRNSFKQRQKSSRKSFHNLQQDKRSKTQWHKPLTNVIFSSHFKGISRNDEFHIDQLVAKGAFGVVFKVINKKQQQQQQQQQQEQHQQGEQQDSCPTVVYALKVLKKSKIISENSLQQIKDEVDIQKLCGHHPFIVKQIDLWQNRYNLHILSEYVPNGELFSTIRTFSLNLVRLYLAEIALALDFLHNAGVIYRDAKPENILLTADYHLKLTDFGLSKWLKFGLTTKTMCGTFQYMAPEILRGEPYTHAVDWWSLGIIVCQMFVKKSPDIRQFITIKLPSHLQPKDSVDKAFNEQKSLESLATESITSSDDFLPLEVHSLPHEARDVLRRLLEFDSQKRIHSVRALQRIAMYKDFSIESQHCLKIHPLDIIKADNIVLKTKDAQEAYNLNPSKAFKDF